MLADKVANFGMVGGEFAIDTLVEAINDFLDGTDTQIGGDQGVFEFLEQVGIDFFFA